MSEIILGKNQYGKAENRIVRIYRDTARHDIHDINVSTCLRGDFTAAHLTGDQTDILPTDTQKQTAYAYAKEKGLHAIEDYGLALARHFVHDITPVHGARIEIDEYAWQRVTIDGTEHNHTWIRTGQETRTTAITVDDTGEYIISGLKELIILKSTGSEFAGFLTDPYTTLQPTHDRVMATSLIAQWRYTTTDLDWNTIYTNVKTALITQFAQVQSLALQQTLYHMGKAVLEQQPDITEIRLSAPNKHHFLYDLTPFGLDNNNEVFNADDRPYGLIQATITRNDTPPPGPAWDHQQGWLA